MNIVIVSVAFSPTGDITVVYTDNGVPKNHTIPKKAELRSALDAILITKIKEALSVLP